MEYFDWLEGYESIIIGLIIITLIIIIYYIFISIKFDGKDYNQRQLNKYYNKITGNDFDNNAKNVIAYGQSINNPTSIDHYMLGSVYLFNKKDHNQAHYHFNKALEKVKETPQDAPFIIDRIVDLQTEFIDIPELADLPLQEAIIESTKIRLNELKLLKENKDVNNIYTQSIILSRHTWKEDPQNVHDCLMYDTLKKQYMIVAKDNLTIDRNIHNFEEFKVWINQEIRNNSCPNDIYKVIDIIEKEFPIDFIDNLNEKQFLEEVWVRIYDNRNTDNRDNMKKSLLISLLECIENNMVVCMSGRTKKIWQSLALLDFNPEIGIFRSKQILESEIYSKCAKIVDNYVGPNGKASDILKQAYIRDENTAAVRDLKESMQKDMDDIILDYKDSPIKNKILDIIKISKESI
jgi:hypothetical protein